MSVLVIGAGLSGLACAWALAEGGQKVTVIQGRAGASEFASGAYDLEPWEDTPDTQLVSAGARRFIEHLGATLPASGAWVATAAGVIRPTRALDDAVLNLGRHSGQLVGVVDVGRPGWDAESLARSFQASDWARRTRTRFAAAVVPLSSADEKLWGRLSPIDWASELGQGRAGSVLVNALDPFGPQWAAFLAGPWLCLTTQATRDLRHRLKRPLGETLSEPGGTAGERFASGRTALLDNLGIEIVLGDARALSSGPNGWQCDADLDVALAATGSATLNATRESSSAWEGRTFEHAVLAVGGLVGGGVRFLSGEEQKGGRSFSLSLKAPVHLRLRRREVVVHSGSQGVDLQALGMDALTRVGVSVGNGFRVDAQQGLFAVGDVVADRPRTALVAVESGLVAAHQILSE